MKVIKGKTRKPYAANENIRNVLDGFCGEGSIAELRCKDGLFQGIYDVGSKEFLEACKKRLVGDIIRQLEKVSRWIKISERGFA